MARHLPRIFVCLLVFALALTAHSQPIAKSAVSVGPGNTKQTGQGFVYRLTYNCSNTSGPCIGAEVVDLLPAEVVFDSTVPASPTGDVASITVTNNFMGSGRTRVRFVMITPLPAGNSGDLLINVHFPNGSTPDGTVATNTADGINLGTSPGTTTTPPVNVTAIANLQVNLTKTLTTTPANLDMPETYRLRITNVSNSNGSLNLTAIGPVTDTLPTGTVFSGSTPAADCQPGCVGTTPATVTWTSPCSVPLTPGNSCDILVNVMFPSGTFPSGTNVTNSFTGTGTPLGKPPASLGVGTLMHSVDTFVADPRVSFSKNMAGNSPNPPTLNQSFSYDLAVSNTGNVPIDNMVIIDTLPVELQVSSVTTGTYTNLSDFVVGEGVRVSYEKNSALGTFTLWGSSPSTGANMTLTAPPPGLGVGEYITRIRWEYGQAAVNMGTSTRPLITGTIINPDHAGGPVAFGDSISNCAALTSIYTAGAVPVNRSDCENFILSGPFAQLNPAKDNLSGNGPFNPGQTVSWRLRIRSASQSSDPVPLEDVVVADLLPVDLLFTSWTFDDQSTGLPAPQNFSQIPNYAGTGRTLLRWEWNAGSGSLGVGQEVRINISTTIRNGSVSGALSNSVTLTHNNPGLGRRCSGSSITDALDFDDDGSTADTLCSASGSANIAPIAQLVSSKTIQGTCDGGAVSTSAGTLTGGGLEYHLRVQNVGTVSMQNFVLIDILPFVGDTGVRDTNPRGSQWTPLLAAPITPPPGTTIYYSTAGNPCRGEVGGPTSGCTPPNWTTVAPDPITSVRSFKVEFGSRVVAPFDFVEFTFVMVTPGNIPSGQSAFNSFAYQADRSDALGSLAAEPQKVGVALGSCNAASLGDFVWVDVNTDGNQNDGPTGVNNVFVQLYQPGPDSLPNTNDDVPLATTITSNGPGGAPGWYNFPGLAPGSYYVRVTPPPTFVFTTPNATADTSDSDANVVTGSSPVVTLAVNENNPTVDFGLVATHFAALGDYVWFDRDSDGIQDESPNDGANGVTVRLFADDGDGVVDAGDVTVRTVVTADDVYGRPGYYLFDGLVPGIPYYVQFVLPAAATGFTTRNAGGNDAIDSDAATSGGTSQIVTLAPDEVNPTVDAGLIAPAGTLSLGDQVWFDTDNDGVFEPENGETGIDDVSLDLYRDVNNDGLPSIDEYLSTTATQTISGFAGRYSFLNLAAGNYIVVVSSDEFNGGGALTGFSTSTGNDPAPDPDDDVNGDDNGRNAGALIASRPVTLSSGGEPTSEDGNANSNLTVDFGFINSTPATLFYDYGDAPDVGAGTSHNNYNTTALDSGPNHLLGVPGAPYLGACVDADSGFLQNAGANADDTGLHTLTVGTCNNPDDDEDGVVFLNPWMTHGFPATIYVTASAAQCHLDAWVDWNQNGVFGDAGEQIAANLIIPPQPGPLTVLTPTPPANAIPGTTYARFRCSSTGGLTPVGSAGDGETEDYVVFVAGYDYGDAPATYPTQGLGAARHFVFSPNPLRLGSCLDTENDGQPLATALGDDASAGGAQIGTCFDDEDGVVFTSPVFACGTTSVSVTANAVGRLDAFVDFDRNGVFDPSDRIFHALTLTAGVNALTFAVPCTASAGISYARFRLSSNGGYNGFGEAPNGEVEDYALTISALDFGDAPDTYATTLGADGARHAVTPGYSLGATVDTESAGQPSSGATGDGADEDGVTVPATLVACSTVSIPVFLTNTAGVSGARLDAWIDYDGDGQFNDPRDRVATSLALVAGANSLMVTVPCNASTTFTYARFRLSSAGIATPTGLAANGEVEDYALAVEAADLGDAPNTYQTLIASGGPRHIIIIGFSLGSTVDAETDGQPNAGASGDGADEDGVTFPAGNILQTCTSVSLTINLTNSAGVTNPRLDAWIDFDGDGQFNDPRDRVATSLVVVAGANALNVSVPCDTTTTNTYARFRLSGAGPGGEVEDYLVSLQALDFGDAPDTYFTTLGVNGPRHIVIAGFALGASVDSEANGQPSAGATGDGADENGVTFPAGNQIRTCTANALSVVLTNTAAIATPRLDAWIDFDADGQFNDPRDRIATALALGAGSNPLTVNAPCDAVSSSTYARFRLSSTSIATPTGSATNGEVEDYALSILGLDYGDAADPAFPTLLASNGARHRVLPASNPTLGPLADTETNGQPSASATGDDAAGVDDEDGVSFPSVLIPGTTGSIAVRTGATGGTVSCWIDFDRNGAWNGAGEKVVSDVLLGNNANTTFTFPVPVGSPSGSAPTRCRIASLGGLGVTAEAADGEVEDHVAAVGVESPLIGTGLCLISVTYSTGPIVTLDIRLENLGNVPLSSVNASLPIASLFSPPVTYVVQSITSADFTVNSGYDGDTDSDVLATGQTLDAHDSGVVRVVLAINLNGSTVNVQLSSTGRGTSPGGTVVTDVSQDGCVVDPDNNQNPADNNTTTALLLGPAGAPTLATWALIAMTALLAFVALRRMAA